MGRPMKFWPMNYSKRWTADTGIVNLLTERFPEYIWIVEHGTIVMRVKVRSGIYVYILTVLSSDIRTDADIYEVGFQAIEGLLEMLKRAKEEDDIG